MPKKLIIVDDDGNISRALNLPYEGTSIDITDMADEDFEIMNQTLHEHKVDLDDKSGKGVFKKRADGLPVIRNKLTGEELIKDTITAP